MPITDIVEPEPKLVIDSGAFINEMMAGARDNVYSSVRILLIEHRQVVTKAHSTVFITLDNLNR